MEEQGAAAGRGVLIVGASFAGLAAAWWMKRLGYRVTVVEMAPGVRKGGTPVDIREGVIEVVRRMGLLERVAAMSLPDRPMVFVDAPGETVASMPSREQMGEELGYEVERDALLEMLYGEVAEGTEFLFGESVAALEQDANGVTATLKSGGTRRVALVLGCDGTHSAVRRLCFGEEARFMKFLGNYFGLSILDKLLLEENTARLWNAPGLAVMVSAYNGKTDIAFCYAAEGETPYDRRDQGAQKRMVREQLAGGGWRTAELLDEMDRADNFYFDKLCQVRMETWTAGRVALVGDAGYCPSPAAGMGGSMAMLGAAALGDALARYGDDVERALRAYDESLRPVVEEIQVRAVEEGLGIFIPRTEEELRARNAQLGGDGSLGGADGASSVAS